MPRLHLAQLTRQSGANGGSGASAREYPFLLVCLDLLRGRMALLLVLLNHEVGRELHHLVIERRVVLEDLGNRNLLEDRLPRALGLAGAAIDALVGMDIELIRKR